MTVYQQISRNKWKTTFLITLFIALILALGYFGGYFIGGSSEYAYSYLFFASIISIIMTLVSYFAGDSLSLAASGAKQIEKEDSRGIFAARCVAANDGCYVSSYRAFAAKT
mgnify:CR=1 FL=1